MPRQVNYSALKFQFKMQLLVILPILLIGLILPVVVFRISNSLVERTREELRTHARFAEASSRYAEVASLSDASLQEIRRNTKQLKSEIEATVESLNSQQSREKDIIVYFISGIVFWFSIFMMFYLHRLIGPVLRLQNMVLMMAEGKEVGEIKVRSLDELQGMAKSLEILRRHIITSREKEALSSKKVKLIIQEMENLAERYSDSKDDKLKLLLVELKREARELKGIEEE